MESCCLNDLFAVCVCSCPTELGISSVNEIVLNEMHEGAESMEFWEGLGGRKRLAYDSLLIGICLCCFLCIEMRHFKTILKCTQ